MLLKTGVQVAMVCPVLGQATIAIYHLCNDINKWTMLNSEGKRDEYQDMPVSKVSRFYYSDGGVTLNYKQCFYIN